MCRRLPLLVNASDHRCRLYDQIFGRSLFAARRSIRRSPLVKIGAILHMFGLSLGACATVFAVWIAGASALLK
jgi:hypothetical protein